MSKEKKLEKVLIVNPQYLKSNIAYAELVEDWPFPKHVLHADEEEGEVTRAALVLYIPYGTMEEIEQLKKLMCMTEEEAMKHISEHAQLKEFMKSAGIDLDAMGIGEGHEHNCDTCPAYDSCDLPIKTARDEGEDEGEKGPLLN